MRQVYEYITLIDPSDNEINENALMGFQVVCATQIPYVDGIHPDSVRYLLERVKQVE